MAESTRTDSWRLERYRQGDERGILELFAAVFGKTRSSEHWIWQFRDNPYGGPFVSVAKTAGADRIVASYSVMPIQLNYLGRAIPACQSVDTAVHPDFRGQKMFEKTASDCYAWCAESGLQAVVGFPNANSYPGFVRGLAWKRVVFPTQYILRLSVGLGLKRLLGADWLAGVLDAIYGSWVRARLAMRGGMLRRLAAGGTSFVVSPTVPEGYEKLWGAWRTQEILSIWKDAKYFQWRYDRNPDCRFAYLHLTRAGEIVALAVAAEMEGALVLCELMVAGRDVATGRLLANHIARYALGRGLRAVTFLGHDAGLFADVLQGFERTVSYTNVFGGRVFVAGALADDLPHADNWTVTFGDGDFV
jgi:hypothetical protein